MLRRCIRQRLLCQTTSRKYGSCKTRVISVCFLAVFTFLATSHNENGSVDAL